MKRFEWIDGLKGLLIVLVVLGHSIQWNFTNPYETFGFKLIYSFHMPLFFFISGYLTIIDTDRVHFQKWLRKILRLLIPFFSWAVLMLGIRILKGELLINSVMLELFNLCMRPDRGLWYLWVLAFCISFCHGIRWIGFQLTAKEATLNLLVIMITMGIIAIFGVSKFAIHLIALYYPYFIGGYYVRKLHLLERCSNNGLVAIATACFALYCVELPFWAWKKDIILGHLTLRNGVFAQFFKMITAWCAIGWLFILIWGIKLRFAYLHTLQWLGCASLGIYGAHYIFLDYLSTYLVWQEEWKVALAFLLSLMLSCILVLIFRRAKCLNLIFLGGR